MRALVLSLPLCIALASPIAAQWGTSFMVAGAAVHGHAVDADGTHIRPESPRTVSLAISRTSGRWRIETGVRHTDASLAVAAAEARVVTPAMMSAWGAGVDVSRRVAGDDAQPTLHAGVGIDASHWTFADAPDDSRWRMSALAMLQGSAAIGGRWRLLLRGEVAVGRSLFVAAELPEGYRLQRATRHGLAVGIERRW